MTDIIVILACFLVAGIGLYIMSVSNDRRIRALATIQDEHDKRLQAVEREANILNWTNDQ